MYMFPIRLNLKYNSSSIMCFAYTIKTGIISGRVFYYSHTYTVALLIFILKFIVSVNGERVEKKIIMGVSYIHNTTK